MKNVFKDTTSWLIFTILILVAIIVVGFIYFTSSGPEQSLVDQSVDVVNTNTTPVDPDTVIARVNDVDLLQRDLTPILNQFTFNARARGFNIEDEQTQADIRADALQTLINTEAVRQEAREQGTEVNEALVDEQIANIIEQAGGQEAFDEQLAASDITEETIREDITNDLRVQNFLDEELELDAIEVTEEEIKERYDTASTTPGVPAFEDAREDIETVLRQEKEQELIGTYLSELVAEADVEIL